MIISRLRVRTRVVVLPRDDVTGRPASRAPAMRLLVAGNELPWTPRSTAGGAVLFSGLDLNRDAPPTGPAGYLLLVEPDPVLRPEQPAGYQFVVPVDPDRWPVRVPVTLLPGPAYPYLPQLPVIHGRVHRATGEPVPDTLVAVLLDSGATAARAATDEAGRFSAGLPRRRTGQALTIRAAGVQRPLDPTDFHRSVDLIVP
jgi:hypothetical protein